MLYIILYTLTTALSLILIHFIGNRMPDMLMVFLSTSYAIIFFNLMNFRKLITTYSQLLAQNKLIFAAMSFTLVLQWLGSFLIPIYFLPSSFLITFFSVLSILGSSSLYLVQKRKLFLIKTLALISNLILFYIFSTTQYSALKSWIFITSTIITGIGGYTYLRLSARLNRSNFSAIEVLSCRFWLLWVVSLIYVIYKHQFSQLELPMIPSTLLIALLSMIIPIYFSQKSIEKLGANKTSLLLGFTPITLVFAEQIIVSNSLSAFIFALMLPLILITFYIYEHMNKKFSKN